MARIEAKRISPSAAYMAPVHVSVLGFFSILGILGGLLIAFVYDPISGAVAVFQGFSLLIFYYVADNIARTRWRLEKLAYELQVVINESLAQATDRERADREAQLAQQAEDE